MVSGSQTTATSTQEIPMDKKPGHTAQGYVRVIIGEDRDQRFQEGLTYELPEGWREGIGNMVANTSTHFELVGG